MMTDEEILVHLILCDSLIDQYKILLKPIVEELARRQSLHVYKEEGRYSGDLGCFESGIDTMCLHNTKPNDPTFSKLETSKVIFRLTSSFREETEKKFFDKVKNIRLTGFR